MENKTFNQFKNTIELHHNYCTGQYEYVSNKVNEILTNICVFDDLVEFEASTELTDEQYYELCEILKNDYSSDLCELLHNEEKKAREEFEHRQCVVYGY